MLDYGWRLPQQESCPASTATSARHWPVLEQTRHDSGIARPCSSTRPDGGAPQPGAPLDGRCQRFLAIVRFLATGRFLAAVCFLAAVGFLVAVGFLATVGFLVAVGFLATVRFFGVKLSERPITVAF
jgi:hypothetical protein